MPEPASEEKMRLDWNRKAVAHFMRYTCGVESGEESDYAAAAKRDATLVLERIGTAETRDWTALDVGCGAGRLIQELAPRFQRVHGVDVSDEMLKLASDRLRSAKNVEFHRIGGGGTLPFADGRFQAIWSYSVFYHLPREVFYRYLGELSRVAAPGAVAIFQMSKLFTLRRWIQGLLRIDPDPQDTNRRRFYTKGELRRLAAAHGFEVVSIEPGPVQDLWCHWRKS